MKWNELKDGQKVVLQQDLVYVDMASATGDYSYVTRAELEKMITVAHKSGTELTLDKLDERLWYQDGEIGIGIDEEIEDALYLVIID